MEMQVIEKVIQKMQNVLTAEQIDTLKKTYIEVLLESEFVNQIDHISYFIASKKIEGCSSRTIELYTQTLRYFEKNISKKLWQMETLDIRTYLANYQKRNGCTNVTLDTVRRILSSFYRWMENEDYILKNPMKRIYKMKQPVVIKTVFTDEEIEMLRNDLSNNKRNIAILNLLISSGIRVSELINLNIDDLNLTTRTGIVKGKGNKERRIYFDIKTKFSIETYLKERNDDLSALFVSQRQYKRYNGKCRIKISNIERIIRQAGNKLSIFKAHPHKFRRTIATRAIDKGMPIEQVQTFLGHSKIDTTLHYAQVQQKNVMNSYQKYIC